MAPGERIKEGDLSGALAELTEEIRNDPADAGKRLFLFQLLCVTGDWRRAMTQLNVAADMRADYKLMAGACRALLNCEVFRAEVFSGDRDPLVLGEPEEWMVWMIQACRLSAAKAHGPAAELRNRAFEAAPAVSGTLDGTPFEWIADACPRMGPVLELIVEGRYYWTPLSNIRLIRMEAPADLRDTVWTPASFVWKNGGQAVGFVPTRYPFSETHEDPGVVLARKTLWQEVGDGDFLGAGQRMLATNLDDYPLMEVREIAFHHDTDAEQEE